MQFDSEEGCMEHKTMVGPSHSPEPYGSIQWQAGDPDGAYRQLCIEEWGFDPYEGSGAHGGMAESPDGLMSYEKVVKEIAQIIDNYGLTREEYEYAKFCWIRGQQYDEETGSNSMAIPFDGSFVLGWTEMVRVQQ